MKKIVILFLLIGSFSANIFAQETAKPLTDMEVVRKVAVLDIDGDIFYNAVMTFKSISPDYFISDRYRVKVTVEDAKGRVVWKRTFRNIFLYVFSNGQVQVGKPNFDIIVVYKNPETGNYIGKVREKEGIY